MSAYSAWAIIVSDFASRRPLFHLIPLRLDRVQPDCRMEIDLKHASEPEKPPRVESVARRKADTVIGRWP